MLKAQEFRFEPQQGELLTSDTYLPNYFKRLETKMVSLENQIQKAVSNLGKKEHYVNAMAVDLEHIVMTLIEQMGNKKQQRIEPTF